MWLYSLLLRLLLAIICFMTTNANVVDRKDKLVKRGGLFCCSGQTY